MFHHGEVEVQRRAGTRGVAIELGAGISNRLDLETGVGFFFESLRLAVVSSVAPDGSVWVSPAFGPSGFVRAESSTSLRLNLRHGVHPKDPLVANAKRSGAPASVLAIDFARRARYRVNGVVATPKRLHGTSEAGAVDAANLWLSVSEAFPNCPKYIQRRTLDPASADRPALSNKAIASHGSSLSAADISLISAADTLFLGTYYEEAGADVNHRGGSPGFVRVTSANEIFWPEYRGNGMFVQSGNLEKNDRAGVCFLDFSSGDVLQLTGRAIIDWNPAVRYDGANRVVHFKIEKLIRTAGMTNYRWSLIGRSPYNPLIGGQNGVSVAKSTGEQNDRNLFPQEVTLVKITTESPLVKTFRFLAPRLIPFLPGQYATFQFEGIPVLDGGNAVVRTWTLSETPNSMMGDNTLEISVKKQNGGLVSSWLHEGAKLGQKVKLLGIDGEMTPITRVEGRAPTFTAPPKLLLISGGIGITPNLAILRGLGAFRLASDVVFIHSQRYERDLPFQKELKRRAKLYNIKMINMISGCADKDVLKDENSVCGRVSEEIILAHVPEPQKREVFLCGPKLFMEVVSKALVNVGVSPSNIHIENFDF